MATRIFTFMLVSVIFSGCVVPVRFYLRNTTTKEVQIKVRLMNEESARIIPYVADILPLSYNLNKTFTNKLKPMNEEGKYLYFNLPPLSTFFVGEGANYSNLTFDQIEIKLKDNESVILNSKSQNLLKLGKSLPSKHFAWYDIEE